LNLSTQNASQITNTLSPFQKGSGKYETGLMTTSEFPVTAYPVEDPS